MGIYYTQVLTIRGDAEELRRLVTRYLVVDEETGFPLSFDEAKIASLPSGLPEGHCADDAGAFILDEFFDVLVREDEALSFRFSTKYLPAAAIVARLGKAFPRLDVRLAALGESQFPYIALCSGGVLTEMEEMEITDAFITEVEGKPLELDDFYLQPSRLRAEPWRTLRFLRAERALAAPLRDYPVYRRPHVGLATTLTPAQAEANLDHFLATRSRRLARLAELLRGFGVALMTADGDLAALDRWIARYGAVLRPPETGAILLTGEPEWSGGFVGRNVIFDLATYLGELAIARHPALGWGLFVEPQSGLRSSSEWHQTIALLCANDGAAARRDVFSDVDTCCRVLRDEAYLRRKPKVCYDSKEESRRFATRTLRRLIEP